MARRSTHLQPPVDEGRDHVLGPANAPLTLVEYGSYDCRSCRAAIDVIADLRDRFGDKLQFVFRNRPIRDSGIAWRAAELAEQAVGPERFWARTPN